MPLYVRSALIVALAAGLALFRPAAAEAAATQDGPAVTRWTREIDRLRPGGPSPRLAEALARRGEALQSLGHRHRALEDFEQAAKLLGADADPGLAAPVTGALGQAYFLAGRPDEAAATLARAVELAERSGNARIAAAALNDRGLMLAATDRSAEALAAFEAAATRAISAGDALTSARARLNAMRLALRAGDASRAAELARHALANLRTGPDSPDKAFHLAAAGDGLRRAGTATRSAGLWSESAATLDESAVIAARLRDRRSTTWALGYRAALLADQGDAREALGYNDRALFAAQAPGETEALFQWQWQAARLFDRLGRPDEALGAYRRALETLGQSRLDFAADLWARRESFGERYGNAYLGQADLLLRLARTSAEPAARGKLLREAQGVIERFKSVELEDYFRDDCVARYLSRVQSIETVAPRTVVLYAIPLEDRLELLASIGSDLHQVTVPVPLARLASEAATLRRLLEKRTTYQYLPHARQLYDWVVRPLLPLLEANGVDTLVFVSDRPLRSIPIGALHDGRQFLIARYAVATAPSLTLVEPRSLAGREARLLASGLTEPVQGYPALPYVGTELDQIATLRNATVLRDEAFTTIGVEQELVQKPYSVVHIASHAQFEADSRRSFLLTWDGRLTLDQLEQHIKQSRLRDDPVELLFLSACQTAAGDERAALGLGGVAVKAGARSALATLWHINDQASSLLVGEFYRGIAEPGTSKAQALRRAQLKMLEDLRYRHPGYWSPFLMIGNWL